MILNLVKSAKDILCKNGKNVEQSLNDINSNLYEIRFGVKTIENVPAGERASMFVAFDTEMPSVPVVTISGFNVYPEYYSTINAAAATKTGFVVYAVNNYTSAGNITFSYIAVCKK